MAMQSYASGYAIYGVWFYPEEDREKILNLLNGYAKGNWTIVAWHWELTVVSLCYTDSF